MRKDGRLELRLDADLRGKIEELARVRGGKVSVAVRRAILDAHRVAFPDAPLKPRLLPVVPIFEDVPEVMPSNVAVFHATLWGRPPSAMHEKLYAAFGRGYVTVFSDEALDAVVTVALHIAPMREADPVVIFARPEVHPSLFDRVTAATAAAGGKTFESSVRATVERMHAGLPSGWPPIEPRVWVAVGVTIDGTVPGWLRRRMVEV